MMCKTANRITLISDYCKNKTLMTKDVFSSSIVRRAQGLHFKYSVMSNINELSKEEKAKKRGKQQK